MNLQSFYESTRTHIPELEIALRLVLAALFGGVIGLDRELRDRPAGLKTHTLTALAAALFTVLTFEIFYKVHISGNAPNGDPIRVIQAVTAGVAFLAAGAIIQNRGEVEGLTTGAGMWLAGALGVACGAGYYQVALIAGILAFLSLAVLRRVERWLRAGSRSQERSPPAPDPTPEYPKRPAIAPKAERRRQRLATGPHRRG